MLAIIISFLVSFLVSFFIVRYSHLRMHLTADHVGGGPKKFHIRSTPRIGGVAVMAGMIASAGIFLLQGKPFTKEMLLLILSSMPAFLSGLIEDTTKKAGVSWRLLLTMVSALMAFYLLDAKLIRLHLPPCG